MPALDQISSWPVDHASAASIVGDSIDAPAIVTFGDQQRRYRLASITKMITSWATLVAVEEGLLALDTPIGQPGCTLAHLLSHAGGYAFDGPDPIAAPERRRMYSNTGIEMAAEAVAAAAGIAFDQYVREAVLDPLGMTSTESTGSPAHAMWSTCDDLVQFTLEIMRPTLISRATADRATQPVFADLAGILPGIGRYPRCSWGLGFEVKGDKAPHWMGTRNSPQAFGHFGGAGTFVWVDLGAAHHRGAACVVLTDRPFDDWAARALELWPTLSDAVLGDAVLGEPGGGPPQ